MTRHPSASWLATILAAGLMVGACGQSSVPSASPATSIPLEPSSAPIPSASVAASLQPSLSPGSGRIVFAQSNGTPTGFNIFTVNSDGSNMRLVLSDKGGLPRWSADGRQIAVVTSSFGSRPFESIANADGTGVRSLPRPDPTLALTCSAWSPDGLRLACEGWGPTKLGKAGLYTVRTLDGGGLQRLSSVADTGDDIPGAYSPDGTEIAFVRITYSPVSLGQLWLCNADGSNARKIVDTLTGYRVSWSPDGRYIAGDANGALEIFDLAALATPPRQIVVPNGAASAPRWSPNGSQLVFQFLRSGASNNDIDTINIDGTGLRRLTLGSKENYSPDWGIAP
jgi:Tol biopolymer transport system component